MSGQVSVTMDKVTYDCRGTPVPIFSTAYGREWREWNTLQWENFDALSDDQEAHREDRRDMALYALDGDSTIVFEGYAAYGVRTSPYSKALNLGAAAGGANIDLTTATADQIDAFFAGSFGAMLRREVVGYNDTGVHLGDSPSGKDPKWWMGELIDSCNHLLAVKKGNSSVATLIHLSGMWLA